MFCSHCRAAATARNKADFTENGSSADFDGYRAVLGINFNEYVTLYDSKQGRPNHVFPKYFLLRAIGSDFAVEQKFAHL